MPHKPTRKPEEVEEQSSIRTIDQTLQHALEALQDFGGLKKAEKLLGRNSRYYKEIEKVEAGDSTNAPMLARFLRSGEAQEVYKECQKLGKPVEDLFFLAMKHIHEPGHESYNKFLIVFSSASKGMDERKQSALHTRIVKFFHFDYEKASMIAEAEKRGYGADLIKKAYKIQDKKELDSFVKTHKLSWFRPAARVLSAVSSLKKAESAGPSMDLVQQRLDLLEQQMNQVLSHLNINKKGKYEADDELAVALAAAKAEKERRKPKKKKST